MSMHLRLSVASSTLFFFKVNGHHRDLHVLTHAFPTRRSSDLQDGVETADGRGFRHLGAALFGLGALGRGGLGHTDGVGSVANRDGYHGLLVSALRSIRDQSAPHAPTPVLPAPRPHRALAPAAGAVHRLWLRATHGQTSTKKHLR